MPGELDLLDATAREDYRDILDFADSSGLRLNECLLRWPGVNGQGKQIVKLGKGGRKIVVRITPLIRSRLHDVAVTTVPDLMRRFHAPGIDFLKLDVEGAERDLLKGQPGWIDKTRIIFAELHDRIVPGCEAVFADATANRRNFVDTSGEKILSVNPD
jgi:hypothetical protein